jgi:hypothetical protein
MKRVKFRSGGARSRWEDDFWLCLHQPRLERDGKKASGYTIEEIRAMTPKEKQFFSDGVWLHQEWLKTREARDTAYERYRATIAERTSKKPGRHNSGAAQPDSEPA